MIVGFINSKDGTIVIDVFIGCFLVLHASLQDSSFTRFVEGVSLIFNHRSSVFAQMSGVMDVPIGHLRCKCEFSLQHIQAFHLF